MKMVSDYSLSERESKDVTKMNVFTHGTTEFVPDRASRSRAPMCTTCWMMSAMISTLICPRDTCPN